MPWLKDHQSNETAKVLVLGDSGAGKSGQLAALAHAGYNLRIMDFDNGLDVLKNVLLDPKSPYDKKAIERVHAITLTDKMTPTGGKLLPGSPDAWRRATELIASWRETEFDPVTKKTNVLVDLGSVLSWTPRDVLVLDSMSFMAEAAFQYVLSLNGRLGKRPEQSDWGVAQENLFNMLKMLYDVNVKCNVVVNAHIEYMNANGVTKGQVVSLGKALSPKVGRFFNSQLLLTKTGLGATEKRQLVTNSTPFMELKSSAPFGVKAAYDIEHGLAEYFADVKRAGGFKMEPMT